MHSSITSPAEKIWWTERVEMTEIIWIAIVVAWGLFMAFMMPYWHAVGKQNLSSEAYRVTPAYYQNKVQTMVDKYTVRTETERNIPVVAPPVGSDVYMLARLWEWWPILELKNNQSYRLHLSSMDWQHGFSLQPVNINTQVLPGYDMVITVTPNKSGDYSIFCNEFCGIGHHRMVGKIYVKD